MENYKKTLQNKLKSQAIMLCCLSAVFTVGQQGYLSKFYPHGNFGDFFRGFHIGIFIGLAMCLIISTVRTGAILKDEKQLKADYIKNTDERNLKISELTGYRLYKSLIMPIIVATIIAGYLSSTVFFTLLAVSLFIGIVTLTKWIYYNKIT
ncbi:MAG: hypothetical protein K2J32_09715 [Ruminococcus sp.]|nr:hypothetical protein [Ruminococcus sp.]